VPGLRPGTAAPGLRPRANLPAVPADGEWVSPGVAAAICAPIGLVVGSFLNVVIWRVPRKESVVRPASHCPGCDAPLRVRDNVPVISWLALRGRCRACGHRISLRYPAVEVACAALFAIVGARFHDSWALPGYLVLVAALLALSVIDLDHFLLPNRVIYPSAAMVVPLLALASYLTDDWGAFGRAVLAAVIDFAIFYVIWFVAPGAMGFGDVRLAALLGFALGWISWPALWLGAFLPFLLGTVGGIAVAAPVVLAPMAIGAALGWWFGADVLERVSGAPPDDVTQARLTSAVGVAVMLGAVVYLVLSAMRRVERGRHIPFGPYLAAGALVAVLALA
jgi:leader peptidase (prepilin peptidase)/N-methyltransferase